MQHSGQYNRPMRKAWIGVGTATTVLLLAIVLWNVRREQQPSELQKVVQSAAQIEQALKQGVSSPRDAEDASPAEPSAGATPSYAYTNRLVREASPYLQMHAHNPVDWYPWGEDAFQRARQENKPIFLSVGYAACHWCGVMERESFSDSKIAEIMNR